MRFNVEMTLTNATSVARRVVIARGTLFEAADPFSRVQNLVAASPAEYALGPGESRAIVIDAWCFNESYAPPDNTSMRLTSLAATTPYTSQADVWTDQARRR